MDAMNFDLANKQLMMSSGNVPMPGRLAPPKPVHRPSIALILLATVVQVIAMAALLWTAGGAP